MDLDVTFGINYLSGTATRTKVIYFGIIVLA